MRHNHKARTRPSAPGNFQFSAHNSCAPSDTQTIALGRSLKTAGGSAITLRHAMHGQFINNEWWKYSRNERSSSMAHHSEEQDEAEH